MIGPVVSILHAVLTIVYLVSPLAFVAFVAWRFRQLREADPAKKQRRSLLVDAVLKLAAAFALGAGIVVVYAFVAGGGIAAVSILEAVKAGYLAIGLMLILTGLDSAIRWCIGLLVDDRNGRKRLAGKGGRAITLFGRLLVFAMISLPFLMSAAMVYRPRVVPPETPGDFGLDYQSVAFTASDGTPLRGWWIDNPQRGKTVVLVHGLGGGKFDVLPTAATLSMNGYDVLLFDLRAHGESGGNLTSFGDRERHDVEAAVAFARETKPDQPVYGVALSMGGAAALAARNDEVGPVFDALVVVDAYDQWSAMADDLVNRQFAQPIRWVARHVAIPSAMIHSGRDLESFRPIDFAADFWPAPLMIIHSRDDNLIDFRHGQSLYEAADEPKRSFWIDGLDHNSVLPEPVVVESILLFFDAVTDRGDLKVV